MGKVEAYRSRHEHINKIGFMEAWKQAASRDLGLPTEPPEGVPREVQRAIVGLARRCEELEYEWS